MDTNNDVYLHALQSLKEDDLSQRVIKPLFESMGCYRVDFHGGAYEGGKDIIAYTRAPLGDHISVLQTKKIGDGKATGDKAIIGNLIFQLQQCYFKDIPLHNGKSKKPDSVILATPYKIGSRLLDEIHGHLTGMRSEIKLLDGPLLLELIKEHNPSLLNSIMGLERKILVQDTFQLQNIELMKALNMDYSIEKINCYNDLAFFMGSIDSHHLLKSQIKITSSKMSLNREGWELLKKKYLVDLERHLEFTPLLDEIQDVEMQFETQLKRHLEDENKKHYEKIISARLEISLLENTLSSIKSELNTFRNQSNNFEDDESVRDVMSVWWPIISDASKTQDYLKIYNDYNSVLTVYSKITELPNSYKINFSDYLSTLASLCLQVNYLKALELQYIQYPLYEYQFNASGIEGWIKSHCDFYADGICKINEGKFDNNKDYIRAFLSNTQKVLIVLEILQELSVETNSVVSFTSSSVTMKDGISISPFTIFDTGHDIAVYGGAGAGKTTTLQMYVEDIIGKGLNNVIYLPLNRLINKASVYFSIEAEASFSYKQILSLILLSKNIDDTNDNVNDLEIALSEKDSLRLVIDGLDEAYNKVPFLLDSINEFKDKYPAIQLIVSSRDCVSFISKINFLGVTLLPFTTEQLYHFINSWFADDIDEAQGLIVDIERGDLKEIVKTPLLATLLCILKKRGIDTPSTEMEIFTRRLKLLCGEYDNFKTIKRSSSDSMQLEKAAMKLAYHLHSRNKRSDSIESMVTYLAYDTTFGYPEGVCSLLVEELINPCNILHLDPLTKHYSFGHLRFQEHLAALELKENRGRDILPLLNKDWWSGTLCLYAQACDFSGLIEDYYRYYGEVSSALKIFKEMVSHRPTRARSNLLSLISQYERTERLEGYAIEEEDDYDDSWRYPLA
ncbi:MULTISPECIES: hypothetical protein [Klebsiella pneumoniae complex]|uniref:hypothetical protein n=1 Tax=Klebsiella pneumoniae complex TaxID=3390273 RepID=UPI000FE17925|nr:MULTISPECIES: hypothetical protein [Klebsiella]MCQ3896594.1 hypothetical protein [Klebsiella quasipneumoniae]QAA74824.1 hypothetical protein D4N21_26730 [Klebsiella variicola]